MSEDIEIIEDEYMQYTANKDLAKRSLTGSFIYLAIWFTIIIPSEFYITATKECLWISILLIGFAIARTVMTKNFDSIYGKSPNVWKWVFSPLILATPLIWGILCALFTINPAYHNISMAFIISTAGLTGGGGSSLAPNKALGILLISVLLIPAGITITFFSTDQDFAVGLLFFIYWFGMYTVINTQYKEYWVGLKNTLIIKQHSAKLKELNTLDGLTGLKNRAFFDKWLRRELKNASRTKSPISLLLIDIDHFKNVNDQYGHLCGDKCLKVFSRLLASMSKRETDVVARYGGEEFAIILPGITAEQTCLFAEKIRCAAEKIEIEYSQEKVCFTISIGITNTTPTMNTLANMVIETADKALYNAKENGRNQVMYKNFNL
jgi:diguanylate cyclase (GGDEF)-like protein